MKSDSVVALHELEKAGQSFDLVYIDGSHQRDDVLIDSLLTWRLSRIGTIIIWDDYGKEGQGNPNEVCVKPAVDLFLSLYAKYASPIDLGYQVVIEKRA
jgi:predicted O-methyltransferase YrrM